MRTPFGTLAVEDFRVGDEILTRPEANAGCEVCVSVVEEIFVRESRLIRLRVQGRDILTSPEHPFWVDGRGWVATEDLNIGDGLSSHNGSWVVLEAIVDTGEVTTVYNLRVADHHTYFVGCDEWGFSVWAHNAYYFLSGILVAKGVQAARAAAGATLSEVEHNLILDGIRGHGKYGGVGDTQSLITAIASATNIQAELQSHYNLANVEKSRIQWKKRLARVRTSLTTSGIPITTVMRGGDPSQHMNKNIFRLVVTRLYRID